MKVFNETKPLHDGLIYFTDGYATQPTIVTKGPCLMVMNNHNHKLKPAPQLFITHFNTI
jgi:predicted metal-dependent peptidase